ncbi:MAG: hypothetical protein OEV89_08910 [Desulfobulbaceae bacterium]|nr:hypothetical protein [Desulfobulbaceae bacterium]HIJ90811.1 hypothetical protein [Deltaproteobacteria bacterium]
MRKSIWCLVALFLAGRVNIAAADDCTATYDPTTSEVNIPCIRLTGDANTYWANLQWADGSNFTLTGSGLRNGEMVIDVWNAGVGGLKISTANHPWGQFRIATLYGYHSDGCTSTYGRPSVTLNGNNLEIQLKAQRPREAICTQALAPFAESVVIPNYLDANGQPLIFTFSVNGTSITPDP